MTGGWIAASVRAQLVASERTLGADAARVLASGTFAQALGSLARSPYRSEIRHDLTLADAQHAVATATLLNLRILAGWLPAEGLPPLRALAAWFELCNLEDRLAYLHGGALRRPFELGSLSSAAWPRAAEAQSVDDLRATLRSSPWGEPDGRTPAELGLLLRLQWARRVECEAPEMQHWAAAAAALLLARALFVDGIPADLLPVPRPRALGTSWLSAATYEQFVAVLPPHAAGLLGGTRSPAELWRAEAAWWRGLAADGAAMLRRSSAGRRKIIGAALVLAADAHLVLTALASADRRDLGGTVEAFDAAA